MKKIRIGILGAADIAKRRFLPALAGSDRCVFAGVAVSGENRIEKAKQFTEQYGGNIWIGYENLLKEADVDAVYIPQPPSEHYKWAKLAMAYGKHVLLEKPSTTKPEDTKELVFLARGANVALLENYGFCFHKQVNVIREIIASGELGTLRLVRAAFGFPHRSNKDFRYQAALGGGALLDCGGYTLKAMELFLGDNPEIKTSCLNYEELHDVDIFGSATLEDRERLTGQVSFGMDNAYRCELELWGSKGCLLAPRFFTPPADFEAQLSVKVGMEQKNICVEADDSFRHTIERFADCISKPELREENESAMIRQMELIGQIQGANPHCDKGE